MTCTCKKNMVSRCAFGKKSCRWEQRGSEQCSAKQFWVQHFKWRFFCHLLASWAESQINCTPSCKLFTEDLYQHVEVMHHALKKVQTTVFECRKASPCFVVKLLIMARDKIQRTCKDQEKSMTWSVRNMGGHNVMADVILSTIFLKWSFGNQQAHLQQFALLFSSHLVLNRISVPRSALDQKHESLKSEF